MSSVDKNSLWTRRQALWLLAGAAGGLSLHACAQSTESSADSTSESTESGSSESMKATMGVVTWVGYTPLYIADEKGFFKDFGLDLELKIFGSNVDGTAAFIAGRLNGWSPVTSEAVLIASKKDYRIVLVEDRSVGADGILARSSISDVAAFKGKRVAVEQGGVSHFFLMQVMAEAGLNADDITIVNTAPDAAAAAYQAGNIDIAVTYAPFLQEANKAQPDGRIIYDSSKMPTAITDLYIFDTAFAEANPQAIEAFVKGIFKGLDFLEQNREEGLAIASNRLEVEPEALAADLEGIDLPDAATNIEMLGNPQSDLYLLESMNSLAQFLVDQGQLESVPELEKLMAPKFVQAVQESV